MMELRALAYCYRVAIAVSECRKAVTGWIHSIRYWTEK
jgi:hypothetical protein